ncbi:hypothetical protein [Kitasatospora kifunensis]|uniref:Uncharacterized protein n=1 Tax=Kitasatospora kifunensis TaxID=58351 RepID=A0A7W7QYZ8_KITKI|nr:hypothetical protein [Kitasatospora kifunensis]MBB4922405.1 hypothetical protein [Kitasatospora kifunensis]
MNEHSPDEAVIRRALQEAGAAAPIGDGDLFADVATARRRRRHRLALAGAVGAVLVVAGSVVAATTLADRPAGVTQVVAAGINGPCPQELGPWNGPQRPGVKDVLVPATPRAAVVCFYDQPSSGTTVFTHSGQVSGAQLTELVTALDAAPPGPMRCAGDARTVASIRFGYPSGADVEVRMGLDGCRNASNGSRDATATAVTVPGTGSGTVTGSPSGASPR